MPLTITIQGTAGAILPSGTYNFGPYSITGGITPVFYSSVLASASATQASWTLTPPSGSLGLTITPPSTNGTALNYKTTLADVGIAIPRATPITIAFDPSSVPTTVYLQTLTTFVGNTQVMFF